MKLITKKELERIRIKENLFEKFIEIANFKLIEAAKLNKTRIYLSNVFNRNDIWVACQKAGLDIHPGADVIEISWTKDEETF